MGETMGRSSREMNALTWAALDACATKAEQTPRTIIRSFKGPGTTAVMAILREATYRKLYFSDNHMLRSGFYDIELAGYDQMAVRRVRLPNEAFEDDGLADISYPGRIVDLCLRQTTNTQDEGEWWERPLYKGLGSCSWRDYSLYMGQGTEPFLADLTAVHRLSRGKPGFDNRFSSVDQMVARLRPEEIVQPNVESYHGIMDNLHDALDQYQDFGETLLECATIAADTGKNGAYHWFVAGANRYGIPFGTGLEMFNR